MAYTLDNLSAELAAIFKSLGFEAKDSDKMMAMTQDQFEAMCKEKTAPPKPSCQTWNFKTKVCEKWMEQKPSFSPDEKLQQYITMATVFMAAIENSIVGIYLKQLPDIVLLIGDVKTGLSIVKPNPLDPPNCKKAAYLMGAVTLLVGTIYKMQPQLEAAVAAGKIGAAPVAGFPWKIVAITAGGALLAGLLLFGKSTPKRTQEIAP